MAKKATKKPVAGRTVKTAKRDFTSDEEALFELCGEAIDYVCNAEFNMVHDHELEHGSYRPTRDQEAIAMAALWRDDDYSYYRGLLEGGLESRCDAIEEEVYA